MTKEEYLKLEYQEALNQIRAYLDSRYKILQFIGFFNAAILTFGFGQEVITINATSMAAIFICILSVSVSILALATEFSLIFYMKKYYFLIKKIEMILNKITGEPLKEVGVFTHGVKVKEHFFHKYLPVNVAIRAFYFILTGFWILFLIQQLNLL